MKNTLVIASGLTVTIILVLSLLVSSGLLPQEFIRINKRKSVPVEQREYSLEELQQDFNRVRTVIQRKHPMLYAERAEVAAVFDAQYSLLEAGMGELDFYRVLSPVAAALNCGHTNVLLSNDYEQYVKEDVLLFPLELRLLNQALYVSKSRTSHTIPTGSQIVSINGFSTQEILDTLFMSIPSDGTNKTRKTALISHQFPFLFHTLIDDAQEFTVTFRNNKKERTQKRILKGARFTELWSKDHQIASIDVLLDMDEIKTDFSKQINKDYAVLSVGSFILNQKRFAGFLDDFFREISNKKTDMLVLDLRDNWGGTPKGAALLLSYLISEPVRYFDEDAPFYLFKYKRAAGPQKHAFRGKVYVLMDGACFSTTSHLISLLKYHGIATLVGEEAGGSAACTDAKRRIVLPNTGIRFYYSTQVFRTDVSGFIPGRGVQPDYEVKASVKNMIADTDTPFIRVLSLEALSK